MSDTAKEVTQRHKQHQQVSLRGASAKEITRDALLNRVSLERELRSYQRRALAAALFIQRVWRRYHVTRRVTDQLLQEWEILLKHQACLASSKWISSNLLRPFLLFAACPSRLQWMLHLMKIQPILSCFEILLQSINSSEPERNFCSLAVGTQEERATWLYQAKKLAFVCSFILAECNPIQEAEDRVQLTLLGMRLIVSLTDPHEWKSVSSNNIFDAGVAVGNLIKFMITSKCGLYNSIRNYVTKLDINIASEDRSPETGRNFLIAASAMTLAFRPFCLRSLCVDNINHLDVEHAAEQYCNFVLTIPRLTQRLPPVLLPALRHESSLLPCLNIQLISQGKVFSEMLKLEESSCYSSKVMPRLGWFLANVIDLVTEYVDDSGQFVKGVDLKTYTLAVNCICEKLLDWLENTGQSKENSNDGKLITGDTCMEMTKDICCKVAPCGSLKISSTDLLKPVCQQWHLRHLLSAAEKCILNNKAFLAAESQTFKCHGNLELLDIVLFYYYMIRICSFLSPLVGSLHILNMLSFTPGFVVKLWEQLENYIFHNSIHATDASKAFRDKTSGHNIGEHTRMSKDSGNKWVNVLAKITGKSYDVDLSNSSNEEACPSNVDSSQYDLWDVEHLRQGNQGVSRNLLYTLHLFCSVYAHLLLVLDDIEFHDKQVPFTLWQQQRISSVLNTFVYGSFIHNCGLSNKPLMDAAVRCLSLLYERDCRHKFCPPSLWIAPARRGRLPIAAAARSHEAVSSNHRCGDTSSNHRVSSVISTIPHVFPFEERVQMFREFIKLDKDARRIAGESTGLGSGSIEIVIRRDHIVEDGFQQLNALGSRLKSCFNISFISECGLPEAGLDYGGLSKEFLTDVSKAAFDPKYGLFSQNSTSEGFLIPNSSARFLENGFEMIEFLGRIVGKALYEGILLDYSFAISFVQKLLGRYSFLDELSTLDPELYKNLIYVKHYEGDIKELALDFTITEEVCGKRIVTELRSGGKNMAVTNENKLQYVYAIADYKLNQQVLPLANAFYRGLTDLISPSWLSIFTANEFNQLLSGGNHDFDVEDLRINTKYTGGYSEGSRTVKIFWEVIKGFKSHERCLLLKFVTSCSRAPLLGFKHLQPAFTIHKVPCDKPLWAMIGGQDVGRLPSSSTCYNTLKLPTYKRASTLRCKLLYAINSNAGFELS